MSGVFGFVGQEPPSPSSATIGRMVSSLEEREWVEVRGDPEGWLRSDWTEWAAGILFGSRAAERGIYDPAAVRSLFDRHMAGSEPATLGNLAPLVTLEMAMRQLLDRVASEAVSGRRLNP